jgi:hypothetical protein
MINETIMNLAEFNETWVFAGTNIYLCADEETTL